MTSEVKPYTRRDLVVAPLRGGLNMVLACDSCGGIGRKPHDAWACDAYYVGKFTARVVLLEVMASGAAPAVMSDGLCCEMEPAGREIIRGITDELGVCGCGGVTLTGSTEENFETSMTGMGLTLVGYAGDEELRFGGGRPGDVILLIGTPALGPGVNLSDDSCYKKLAALLNCPDVREIVPAGSKGVMHEARLLAELNGLPLLLFSCGVDLTASAGPATCMVALCHPRAADAFPDYIVIGKLD